MMLADLGADVVRVDRIGGLDGRGNVLCRNRRSLAVDLQTAEGQALIRNLITKADALIEGFRPGVMERLGLGPDLCLKLNPKLVYGRMTGWGQEGPLASVAGHDINYISLTGVAHAVGRPGGPPVLPLNLVGDYGGGGMMLAFGVMAALWQANRSGRGQVIDAAMIDGASALMAEYFGFLAAGQFEGERGTHLLDGGAYFYGVYETSDGQYVSIGALEPKFYALLREKLSLSDEIWHCQMDEALWPEQRRRLEAIFLTKTRDEWTALLEGTEICFAPVLSMREAAGHPHNRARGTLIEVDGMLQGAPAPRFIGTPASYPKRGRAPGADSEAVLRSFGIASERIAELIARSVVAQWTDKVSK
jgi:alpha-methylacyl-CoA racemase